MPGQTEISASTAFRAAPVSNVDAGPLPWDSIRGARQQWEAEADASAVHATAKRPFWRLGGYLQLTTLLFLATLAAAFMLLHCYRQHTFVGSRGRGPLRLLAEGEGTGRGFPCGEADMESHQSPAGASDSVEPAILERTEGVVRRLIQVTKDCSSVAALLPSPFPVKVVYLFLGFCIQEVAALSALLGSQFEKQKVDVLQKAVGAAREVKCVCHERISKSQQKHASRLEKYAEDIRNAVPEYPSLANEMRSQMLKQLLELQEMALAVIEAVVSSVLKPQYTRTQVTEELAHELVEELKRVIYTRRRQVFKSRLLSHSLRYVESSRTRGNLIDLLTIKQLDVEPEQGLNEQLADLLHGLGWIKKPQEKDQNNMSEASARKNRSPAVYHESQGMHSVATEDAHASKSRSGRNHKRFEVPPRFQDSDIVSGMGMKKKRNKQTHEGHERTHPNHSQHTQLTPGAFSPSYEARSGEASQAMRHPAPATASPPGQPLAETNAPLSELSHVPQARSAAGQSSGPAATSSVDTRLQVIAPPAEKIQKESWGGMEVQESVGSSGEASWSPWSSTWVSPLTVSPRLPIPDSTATATVDMARALEGVSSYQLTQHAVSVQWDFMSPRVSSTFSFPFTTPQLIAAAASEMLHTERSQGLPAEMQTLAHSHSGFTSNAPSSSTSSSLIREGTFHSVGVPRSSEPERVPAHLDSVEEGIFHSEENMQGLPGLPFAVSGLLELLDWEPSEGFLEESHWLESDSDSG